MRVSPFNLVSFMFNSRKRFMAHANYTPHNRPAHPSVALGGANTWVGAEVVIFWTQWGGGGGEGSSRWAERA